MVGREQQEDKVVVTIATYQRPDMLAQLLKSLQTEMNVSLRIVVVDNDPAGSARNVIQQFGNVEYVHEKKPGIVAARNAGLGHVRDEDYVVFVDDDEWVCDRWLKRLLDTAYDYSADAVVGPVLPVFPEGAPKWATEGYYFRRRRFATGKTLSVAPTNNTLLRVDAMRRLSVPKFDERFSETGGSDTEFFLRIAATGAKIVWCDEALAWEHVPRGRMTRKWVVRRQIRLGNVKGRLTAEHRSIIHAFGLSGLYITYGALAQVLSVVTFRGRSSFAEMRFWRGVGIIQSLRGNLVYEYRRSQSTENLDPKE